MVSTPGESSPNGSSPDESSRDGKMGEVEGWRGEERRAVLIVSAPDEDSR